jgi:hypothetical protein
MEDRDCERYIRWQDYRITQFSFAINLFLTFGMAALGFWASLLTDQSFQMPKGQEYLFKYALVTLSVSVVTGTVAVISRLLDFRYTALKIRKKYSGWRQKYVELLSEKLGGVSLALFWLQIVTLAVGVWCLMSAVLAVHGEKIASLASN